MKKDDIKDILDSNKINSFSSYFNYSQLADLNKNLVESLSPAYSITSKVASLNKRYAAISSAYLERPTNTMSVNASKYIKNLHKDLALGVLPNIKNFNTDVWYKGVIASFERIKKLTNVFERQFKVLNYFPHIMQFSPKDVSNLIIPKEEIALSLADNHWIMLLRDSKIDKELLNECKESENNNFNEIVQNFYSRNNHKNVFRKIDYLIGADYSKKEVKLVDGFHDQIKRVRKILFRAFSDSEVLISTVMTWIEYAVAEKFGVLEDKNGYKLGGRIEEFEEKIEKLELKEITLLVVDYYNIFFYLSDLWNSRLQDFEDGKDQVGIGRHSIQHARVNPKRYTDEVMSKLICLLYALVKLPDLDEFESFLQV